MQPTIASYTDFSASSVHKIQPRYEALKHSKKKRKYQSEPKLPEAARPKTLDKFSMNDIVLIDTNISQPDLSTKADKAEKSRLKPCLDNKSEFPKLEWDFKPWTKHRENWLFMRAKPESHFTPKQPVKKIPVSYAATLVKNSIVTNKEREVSNKSETKDGKSGKLSWSRVSNASDR